MERSVCLGMPRMICTMHIVAHRWGCGGGEGVVGPLPGLLDSGALGAESAQFLLSSCGPFSALFT